MMARMTDSATAGRSPLPSNVSQVGVVKDELLEIRGRRQKVRKSFFLVRKVGDGDLKLLLFGLWEQPEVSVPKNACVVPFAEPWVAPMAACFLWQ